MVAVSILFLSASTCIPQTLENRTSSAAVSAEVPLFAITEFTPEPILARTTQSVSEVNPNFCIA